MKTIQHTVPFNPLLEKKELSSNLQSFLDRMQEQFSFDAAHIYHLTNENLNDYKHVIIKGISSKLRQVRSMSINESPNSFIEDVNEHFDNMIEANFFPKSLIVFDHVYTSTVESSMIFFEENNDILLISTKFSTLDLGSSSSMFDRINLPNGSSFPLVSQALAYESSTTAGFFSFFSYLLPVNHEMNRFEVSDLNKHHKKAELQIRFLDARQVEFKKLMLPENFDKSHYLNPYKPLHILNTRLIYNSEIIFNDYNIITEGDLRALVLDKLLPFSTDLKKDYELVDNVCVRLTADYYDHFKQNIWPVIEMAKI